MTNEAIVEFGLGADKLQISTVEDLDNLIMRLLEARQDAFGEAPAYVALSTYQDDTFVLIGHIMDAIDHLNASAGGPAHAHLVFDPVH